MFGYCDQTLWYNLILWIINMSCEKKEEKCTNVRYHSIRWATSSLQSSWNLLTAFLTPCPATEVIWVIFRHCVKIRTHVTGTRVYGVTGVPPSCIEQAELASCSSAPVKVKCQLPPVAGLGLETFGSTCSLDTGIMQTWNHNCFHSPGNRYRYSYCMLGASILINGLGKLTQIS